VKNRIVSTPLVDIPEMHRIGELEEESTNERKVTARGLTYEGMIYVPKNALFGNNIISLFHDNPESGHFCDLKTAELVSRDFHLPAMDPKVRIYIA